MNCLFCRIADNKIPAHIVYDNGTVVAFLDIGPVSKGHMVIVPKRHATDLADGSEKVALELMRVIYEIAPKVMHALGATAYNLGMNHGADAGQEIWHTHIHLIPRYAGDKREFVKSHPSDEELVATARIIKAAL